VAFVGRTLKGEIFVNKLASVLSGSLVVFSIGAFVALHAPKVYLNFLYLPAFAGVCIAFGLYAASSKSN
jgi:hypothetical protein